jgi:hypothetical protein
LVRCVNDIFFGLGATDWMADCRHGIVEAERFELGTASDKRHLDPYPATRFAGIKRWGIGYKSAMNGLRSIMKRKIINVAKARRTQPA